MAKKTPKTLADFSCIFVLVAPGLILDAPGCHQKKGAVTWQVYLFAAVGLPPKKQHTSCFCGFPSILQGLILDAPGCKEAKVSSATVLLWFLLCSAILVPGTWVCTSHPGGNMPRKVEPKKWPKKALFEIRPGASQANKKWAGFLWYRWEFRSINIR